MGVNKPTSAQKTMRKPRFSQPSGGPLDKEKNESTGNARLLRIVHIDDENWFGELAEAIIKDTFREVQLLRFQDSETAWVELQRSDPDLLITDMNNTNVPGRNQYMGMGGWKLLPLLASRKVQYPILVVSGSFSMRGVERRAMACAGSALNISFMTKPFPVEFFKSEMVRLLIWKRHFGRRSSNDAL
jgi:DNA-binding NtrC family response regulator